MFLSEWREFPSAPWMCSVYYSGADKSLARPGRQQANLSVRMAWISFGALPCRKRNLMTARVTMLLRSRTYLTCFRVCLLPDRSKDLSAPPYVLHPSHYNAQTAASRGRTRFPITWNKSMRHSGPVLRSRCNRTEIPRTQILLSHSVFIFRIEVGAWHV